MVQIGNSKDLAGASRRILFITQGGLWGLISPFLVNMSCVCCRVSSNELDAILEHEIFDAVLLQADHSQIPAKQALRKIKKTRSSLLKRVLVIRLSQTEPQEIELMDPHNVVKLSRKISIEGLWAALRDIFAQLSVVAPPSVITAQLIMDSSRLPVPAGLRGPASHSRQLVYRHESTTIDLLIEPRGSSRGLSITGQVLDRNWKSRENSSLPVLLTSGMRNQGRASTNQFGEFNLECESVESILENTCVEVRLGEGAWVSLPIGKMGWQRERTEELDRKAG